MRILGWTYELGSTRLLRVGTPTHLDAVGVVDQPVEDAVGKRGIADLLVPARHRELRSQDRRAHLVRSSQISHSDSSARNARASGYAKLPPDFSVTIVTARRGAD